MCNSKGFCLLSAGQNVLALHYMYSTSYELIHRIPYFLCVLLGKLTHQNDCGKKYLLENEGSRANGEPFGVEIMQAIIDS